MNVALRTSARILIVDDQPANCELLSELVRALGHEPLVCNSGAEALSVVRGNELDLMLLDIVMPGMDGHAVLEEMQTQGHLAKLPVIVISGLTQMDSVVRCIEAGSDDYLTKPVNLALLRARINSSLEKKRLRDRAERERLRVEQYNRTLEACVRQQVEEITHGQLTTIFALSKLAEFRDPETGQHLERMREYARALALHLMKKPSHSKLITEDLVWNIYSAAPLHDIGKVGTPDHILLKEGPLTPAEFTIMKEHVNIGAETLHAVNRQHPGNSFVEVGIEMLEGHHERWNGTGYPRGLKDLEIPLSARILALADVYDALTSKRCYKEAFSHEKSRAIIVEGNNEDFDPDVVTAFLEIEIEFKNIRAEFPDNEGLTIQRRESNAHSDC